MDQQTQHNTSIFGPVSGCQTFQDAVAYLHKDYQTRPATAAFALYLAATQSEPQTKYRINTLRILDAMAHAKAEIDSTTAHHMEVVAVTSSIMLRTQRFVYDTTIPCTEWPYPQEVLNVVYEEACRWCPKPQNVSLITSA